jgi:hypothetical protein
MEQIHVSQVREQIKYVEPVSNFYLSPSKIHNNPKPEIFR